MPAEIIIPTNYLEWRHCIEIQCRQPLTAAYCEQRIAALQNQTDPHTREFIRLYGEAHWRNTLSWFAQARASHS